MKKTKKNQSVNGFQVAAQKNLLKVYTIGSLRKKYGVQF